MDHPARVREVSALPVRPQLLVLHGGPVDAEDLRRRGWREEVASVHLSASADQLVGVRSAGIRQVREADLPVARTVMDLAFGEHDSALVLPDGVTRTPDLRVLLAQDDDGYPVGVAGFRLRRQGALLFGVGVLRHARHHRVGRALVAACAAWALEHGETVLHCRAEPGALSFWQGLGFVEHSRWRSFEPAG